MKKETIQPVKRVLKELALFAALENLLNERPATEKEKENIKQLLNLKK